MNIDKKQHKHHARPEAAGYILLTVLIAVGVITGLVAAYGRHVIVQGRGGMASMPLLESREACFSGVRFARQSLVSGAAFGTQTIPAGMNSATYTVTPLPLGNTSLFVQSVGEDGLGARRLLEVGAKPTPDSVPVSPASLPTLDAVTVAGLVADSSLPVKHFTSSQTLQGVELSGLMVVHPDVDLVLDDVVLQGAFVSSKVLDQSEWGGYDSNIAPRLLIDGNLRIDPHASLPGVAVLMPDGAISSVGSTARVQIHGDVVAHDVQLSHSGVLAGNVSAVQSTLASPDQLDRLGLNREGIDWSSELQLGGVHEPVFLAAVPPATDSIPLGGIVDFWSAGN